VFTFFSLVSTTLAINMPKVLTMLSNKFSSNGVFLGVPNPDPVRKQIESVIIFKSGVANPKHFFPDPDQDSTWRVIMDLDPTLKVVSCLFF